MLELIGRYSSARKLEGLGGMTMDIINLCGGKTEAWLSSTSGGGDLKLLVPLLSVV